MARAPRPVRWAVGLLLAAAAAGAQAPPPDSARGPAAVPAPDAAPALPALTASRTGGRVQRYDLGRHGTFLYGRPVRLRAIREIPATVAHTAVLGTRRSALDDWGATLVGTAALWGADEYLVDKTRMLARHVGLPPNHPSVNIRFWGMKVALPSTLGSGLYFLGDGMADLMVAGGFLWHGARHDDQRARTTASQIASGLVSLGVYTQLLKRTFGRQTPNEATEPRGRWRPFPPLVDYNANVPAYDAMPSGHMAAAMSTVEIIALNYPEKRFVRPLGYTLMTALGFAMVNNGVHWASDYPLALLIGGGVARVTVARGRTRVDAAPRAAPGLSWTPIVTPRALGVSLTLP